MQSESVTTKTTESPSNQKKTDAGAAGGWRLQLKSALRGGGNLAAQELMLKPSAKPGGERSREGAPLQDGSVVLAPPVWQGEPHETATDPSTETRSSNPALASENANRSNTGVTYQSHAPEGADAAGDIEYTDVAQGNLSDCYLLASLSAVARTDPDRIRNMITFLGNNRYQVRFYEWRFLQGYCAHYETITATFPTMSGGGMMYGRSQEHTANSPELWPAIIERAYAQWKGGYGDMESGSAENALEHITGVEADTEDVSDYTDASLLQELRTRLADGHPVVADTPGSGKKVTQNGFVTGHSYTVVSVSGNDITVRNPWGGASAEQTISASVFRQVFVRLRLSGA